MFQMTQTLREPRRAGAMSSAALSMACCRPSSVWACIATRGSKLQEKCASENRVL
jgi:hypothetical protein